MTVNVTSGPGLAAYNSTRYTATVNGSTAWVVGQTNQTTLQSGIWAAGDSVEISWVKFNANETATVRITRIAGAITSAVVYPKGVASSSIVGGVLVLTVPTQTRLHVEINGDRKNIIAVFSNPIAQAVPAGAVYWNAVGVKTVSVDSGTDTFTSASHGLVNGQRVGYRSTGTYPTASGGDLAAHTHYYVINATTNTFQLERTAGGGVINLSSNGTGTQTVYITGWTNTTNALVFPSGEWHFGRMFQLADNVKIVFEAAAVAIGGFDLRARNGVNIFGEGLILGTFTPWLTLQDFVTFDSFAKLLPYSMFLGDDFLTTTSYYWSNTLQGVTVANYPFFFNMDGLCDIKDVQVVNPWFYGTAGPNLSPQVQGNAVGIMDRCYVYSGDDGLILGEQGADVFQVVQNSFVVTGNNACLHLSYWGDPDRGFSTIVRDCELMHVGLADTGPGSDAFPAYGNMSVIRAWTDRDRGEESYGRFDVTISDCRVWGPHQNRFVAIGNRGYPYGGFDAAASEKIGQVANWVFANIAIEEVPGRVSTIEGLDWLNTPHDLQFSNITFAGEPLTTFNWSTYFSTNVFPYAITVGGRTVVVAADVCNQALAAVAAKARITSISPPDSGSIEAEHCARYYSEAIESLLEMHEWSFATKRVALVKAGDTDTTSWLYRYQIPSDMCRAIAVLPEGVTHDRISEGIRAPVEFVRELDEDGIMRIYTNEVDATLRYTAWVTDPNKWSPLFRQAVVAMLASKLAGPLWRGQEGESVKQRCLRDVEVYLARAKASDSNQQKVRPSPQTAIYHQNRMRGGRAER